MCIFYEKALWSSIFTVCVRMVGYSARGNIPIETLTVHPTEDNSVSRSLTITTPPRICRRIN